MFSSWKKSRWRFARRDNCRFHLSNLQLYSKAVLKKCFSVVFSVSSVKWGGRSGPDAHNKYGHLFRGNRRRPLGQRLEGVRKGKATAGGECEATFLHESYAQVGP